MPFIYPHRQHTAIIIIDVGKRWVRIRQGSGEDEKEGGLLKQ